jgi:hypothetical protein
VEAAPAAVARLKHALGPAAPHRGLTAAPAACDVVVAPDVPAESEKAG